MASRKSTLADELLTTSRWGLAHARAHAERLLTYPDRVRAARSLVTALITRDAEQRVRAADVARRTTERDVAFLAPFATELASVLGETPVAESRTRWHLGLAVARTARTPPQIRTAAALLWQLSEDGSNVVRCSAIEGLSLLTLHDRTLRSSVEPYLQDALISGTPAMRVRARDALRRLSSNNERSLVSEFGHRIVSMDTPSRQRVARAAASD